MNYFTELETNVKGVETKVTLGACTAIVGENRSGKTAIIRALELALRPAPAAAMAQRLFKLAPVGADRLHSRVAGPLGSAFFDVIKDATGRIRAPSQGYTDEGSTSSNRLTQLSDEQLENILPAYSMRELMDLGPAKGREALFRRFGQLNGGLPEPLGLGAEGRKVWKDAESESSRGCSNIADVLANMGTWFRKEKRRLSDDLKMTTARIEENAESVENESGGVEILSELEEQYRKALAFEATARARFELEILQARLRDSIHEAAAKPDWAQIDDNCPTCGREYEGPAPISVNLREQIKVFQEITQSSEDYIGPPSQAIRETVRTIQKADTIRAMFEADQLTARDIKINQALVKELEQKAAHQLHTLSTKVKAAAESAVNKYMPGKFEAQLNLENEACSWTVLDPVHGEPRDKDTMSGAEKAGLIVALACAWTEHSPVRVVTLDDADLGPFHSSPVNLVALLTSLQDAVAHGDLTQVIVAGIRHDEVPDGWTVVKR